MTESRHDPEDKPSSTTEALTEVVSLKEQRRMKAKEEEQRQWLQWVGYFGIIGWSISIPIVGGTLVGWWIDRRWPSDRSWTLILLAAGLVIGCVGAWRWLNHEGGPR